MGERIALNLSHVLSSQCTCYCPTFGDQTANGILIGVGLTFAFCCLCLVCGVLNEV